VTTSAPNKDGITEYRGSCHCGKVTYSVNLEKLPIATDCNCSICSRVCSPFPKTRFPTCKATLTKTPKQNAYLWIYPKAEEVQVQGREHLNCYRFGTKTAGHAFCTTCGVSIINQRVGWKATHQPINLRCLNGVDLDKLESEKVDGKSDVLGS